MAFNNTPVLQPFTLLSYITCMWFHSFDDFIHFIQTEQPKWKAGHNVMLIKNLVTYLLFAPPFGPFLLETYFWIIVLVVFSFTYYEALGSPLNGWSKCARSHVLSLHGVCSGCLMSGCRWHHEHVHVHIYTQHLSDRLLQAAPFSVSFHSVLYAHVACASIFCQWQIISKGPSVTEENCCCLFGLLCLENHSSTAVSELQTFESAHKKKHTVFSFCLSWEKEIYICPQVTMAH